MGLQKGFSNNCIKKLSSVIRNNDEFDLVGIIYSMVTQEPDHHIKDGYTYQEILNVYKRIDKIYGTDIKIQLIKFVKYLEKKYFIDYDNFAKQNFIIKENNLIIEKRKKEIPFVSNKFNAQFITNEVLFFCETQQEE